jgi:hypothetical protein
MSIKDMVDKASFEDIKKKTAPLRLLEENWDSYGAPPPNPEEIDMAERIALKLEGLLGNKESFTPVSDGFSVEWHQGGWDIEIYISNKRKNVSRT